MQPMKFVEALKLLKLEHSQEKMILTGGTRDEVTGIVSEFLEAIYKIAAIPKLQEKLSKLHQIDFTAVMRVVDIIENNPPEGITHKFTDGKQRKVDPTAILRNLKEGISSIMGLEKKFGRLDIYFRFELYYDSMFDELLMCYPDRSAVLVELKSMIVKKLENIQDNIMLLLWARVKAQFPADVDRGGFRRYDEIIPEDVWKQHDSIEDIRNIYADFIVRYKPMTIRRMIQDGESGHPISFGIGRILAIFNEIGSETVTELEILLFRGLSRIVALNSLITPGRSKEDIAASIGESDKSLLFDGEYFHEAEKEFGDLNASKDTLFELLTNLMARVVLYAEEISVNETDMTRILFNYKLGQEVLGDGRRKAIISIEKNGEKILQREMCRHLLENNILAYGREFGRSQIDLYTKDVGGEEYAIEVKLRKTKPNEEFITKSLAQLLNYMDQLNQPRGILVIYNCTEVLITSPRRWFQGRIWVLPINLCVTSPSQRKSVLDIEEAKGSSEFVRCRILGITGRRPPGRGKKLTLPSGTPSRK